MFTTYRPNVEHSILFMKTVNILKDENFFGGSEVLTAVLYSQVLENVFVHNTNTVTNVYVWLVKNLFWLVNQTCCD